MSPGEPEAGAPAGARAGDSADLRRRSLLLLGAALVSPFFRAPPGAAEEREPMSDLALFTFSLWGSISLTWLLSLSPKTRWLIG